MGGGEVSSTIVHLEWSGPYLYPEARMCNADGDWGIYQIYGDHPVYGSDVLLYIGKAERQTFGARLAQPHSMPYCYPIERTSVYFGRLAGALAPDDEPWNQQIVFAESLLIFAHRPAWNSQMNFQKLDTHLRDVHVINWGDCRSLMAEVSGARWCATRNDVPGWHTFKSDSPRLFQST